MKHPSTRELFEYWNKQRGRRPAPERNDIEPGAIRRVLADTFVLAFDTAKGHPFRIAGTRVCAAFGRELKGEQFVGLWDEPSRTLVRDLVHIVAHEAVGVVASAACANAEGARLDLELLILPLSHRTRTDSRLMGTLAPVGAPHWLGISSIGPLSLGTLRYVGSGIAPVDAPQLVPSLRNGRRRHGFIVYDGGQA